MKASKHGVDIPITVYKLDSILLHQLPSLINALSWFKNVWVIFNHGSRAICIVSDEVLW